MTQQQFNVRLEKLQQQMVEVSLRWNKEFLGRNISNKQLVQDALQLYFMKLLHSDHEGVLKLLQENQYNELLKMVKLNQID